MGSHLSGGSSCSRERRSSENHFVSLLSATVVHCRLLFTKPYGQLHTAECWRFHSAFQDQVPNPCAAKAQSRCPMWKTGCVLGTPLHSNPLCQPTWKHCEYLLHSWVFSACCKTLCSAWAWLWQRKWLMISAHL